MKIILGIILAGFVATVSQAQTRAEVDTCKPDAVRICDARFVDLFNYDRVKKCLKENRALLSSQCRAVLAAHGM